VYRKEENPEGRFLRILEKGRLKRRLQERMD